MERKEDTAQRITRRNYELTHKEERKAKSIVWGTSINRNLGEAINRFLEKYGFTKVELIEAGYKALTDKTVKQDFSSQE